MAGCTCVGKWLREEEGRREEEKNIPFCRSILQAVPPPSKLPMRNAPSRPVLPLTQTNTSAPEEKMSFFSLGENSQLQRKKNEERRKYCY
jgi:hypothetical protein